VSEEKTQDALREALRQDLREMMPGEKESEA